MASILRFRKLCFVEPDLSNPKNLARKKKLRPRLWGGSFTEIRDQTLGRLKSQIELMYVINGYKKMVVVPHSMVIIYFLHFLKWVEAPPPRGGGGDPGWCAKHIIKGNMNIGPVFLSVPKTISNIFSAEAKDVASIRAMDPGLLDSEIPGLQTLEHVMRVTRTWDSIASLLPKEERSSGVIWIGLLR